MINQIPFEKRYNARLKIVGLYEDKILDIVKISDSFKVGDISLDTKVVSAGRIKGVKQGLGLSTAGRTFTVSIPVLYKNKELDITGIQQQINEILSWTAHAYINKYYMLYNFDGEDYQAELILDKISGYTLKSVLDVGSLSISFKQIDNYFYSSEKKEIQLNILEGEGERHTQDIEINCESYVPTASDFEIKVNCIKGDLFFYLANKDNYGVSIAKNVGAGEHTLKFNEKTFLIDDVAVAFDGVRLLLNSKKNILYYECDADFIEGKLIYNKGIIL